MNTAPSEPTGGGPAILQVMASIAGDLENPQAEYLWAADVAQILPLSDGEITSMAGQTGGLLQMMALMACAHENLRTHGDVHLEPGVFRELYFDVGDTRVHDNLWADDGGEVLLAPGVVHHFHAGVVRERATRQRRERQPAEFLQAEDVARILPFSVSQIISMAQEPGSLPGFKLPGCAKWLFDETVVRKWIAIYVKDIPERGVTPCRNRKMSTKTTTSRSGTVSGTSGTKSAGPQSDSPLVRRMLKKLGRGATKSSKR